ncbi:MAG: GNAT family N-acetyltransferase [Pseudomonadota bacterium]
MAEHPVFEQIAGLPAARQASLRALNNLHARETSHLEPEAWHALVSGAFLALAPSDDLALLIAYAPGAGYQSENYRWFSERYDRFAYVDRIIVSEAARSRGLARALYGALAEAALEADHRTLCCEVNRDPPNPGSDAFHDRLGFREVGSQTLASNGKTVRYLVADPSGLV